MRLFDLETGIIEGEDCVFEFNKEFLLLVFRASELRYLLPLLLSSVVAEVLS